MKTVTFTVPHPIGYKRITHYGKNSPTAKRYHKFMEDVQWCARAAGLQLPLHATDDEPLYISTRCQFRDRRHPDPGNVQKAVEDALFYEGAGGDRCVGGRYWPAVIGAPQVEVTVSDSPF